MSFPCKGESILVIYFYFAMRLYDGFAPSGARYFLCANKDLHMEVLTPWRPGMAESGATNKRSLRTSLCSRDISTVPVQKNRPPLLVSSVSFLFFALSGFDSHPCLTKPDKASLPRSYINFSKNFKTHTPAHGGVFARKHNRAY